MTTHLEIQLTCAEGALLRTLGLVQRRGFRVSEAALHSFEGHQLLRLAVDGHGRCPDLLVRQIDRLHDVSRVAQIDLQPWQPPAPDPVSALSSLVQAGDAVASKFHPPAWSSQ